MDLAQHRHMPPVSALMTPFPWFVRPEDPVSRVRELMQQHAIRHVPVKQDDRVVGLISEADLRALAMQAPGGRDPLAARVCDLQAPPPYVVDLSSPLGPVLLEMASRHAGSAIVLRAGRLAGIITETDVCRALGELLQHRFGPGSGDAA